MIIHGNFIGAAIVAILYTVYILWNPGLIKSKPTFITLLILLNLLTIVLLSQAFK